jgi:3-dehydroquinate synthetase
VIADPHILSTLPTQEYISGMAEVVKHGIIADEELFFALSPEKIPLTRDLLQRALAVKLNIVHSDPFELGQRAILNLGHTIGHGIEAASNYSMRHGEAISIGMIAEARLAERMSLAEEGLAVQIANQLQALGLPINCPGLRPDRIHAAMSTDKKKHSGKLKFSLPTAIGTVEYGLTVPDEMLHEEIAAVTTIG